MSDDSKSHDDQAHETMPPELRPFMKPAAPQRLVAPGDEADFKAAVDALRLLNGGPQADPFYVDPKEDAAAAGERKAPPSVTAYAPPAVVPAAEAKARKAVAGTKVVIINADGDAPASEKPASSQPASGFSRGRVKTAAIVLAMVVVAVEIGMRALGTGRTRGIATDGPAPTAPVSAAAPPSPVMSAAPVPSAAPPSSVVPAGSAAVPAASSPEVLPKQGSAAAARPSSAASEDPYRDAAVAPPKPAPKATAAPSVSPSTQPAVPSSSAQPATTGAPTSAPSTRPNPIAGERTFGN